MAPSGADCVVSEACGWPAQRRSGAYPPARCALHARPCRHAVQPRPRGKDARPSGRPENPQASPVSRPDAKLLETANALVNATRLAAETRPEPLAALAAAGLLRTASMATGPVIRGDRPRPGQHLDPIGACRPDRRAVDDTAQRPARIRVDARPPRSTTSARSQPPSPGESSHPKRSWPVSPTSPRAAAPAPARTRSPSARTAAPIATR